MLGEELDHALIDAAGNLDRWPTLLEGLAQRFGAMGAAVIPFADPLMMRHSPGIRPQFEAYFNDGIHLVDARLALAPKMATHKVVDDLDAYSPRQMARMPYYQDWIPEHDLGAFAAVHGGSPAEPMAVTLYRGRGERGFDAGEKRQLAVLSDRIVRAVAIDRAVGTGLLTQQADWLERSGAAVLGLDRSGRVSFMADQARRFLASPRAGGSRLGAGMKVRHGQLVFASASDGKTFETMLARSERARLRAALNQATTDPGPARFYVRSTTDWTGAHGAGAFVPSYATAVDIHPVDPAHGTFVHAAHLVVLSDPFRTPSADAGVFVALWDLTAREAELVCHLVSGLLLREAAGRMGVRESSARTYLKAVYRKTGTRAQSELVACAARLVR